MQSVLNIIEPLVYQYIVGTQTARLRRIGPSIMLGVLFTAGCLFITFGFFMWISATYGAPLAAMITGLFLILISALVLGYMNYKARRELVLLERRHQELMVTAQELTAQSGEVARELEEFVYTSPKQTMLFASIAGFLLSDFIKPRAR